MSRNLQAATNSACSAQEVHYRLLVEVHSTSSGVTRACNGDRYISFAANTYSPVGTLGGLDSIQEDSDVFPRACRIWFAAVNTTQIQDVLSESMFNCPVKVFRGFVRTSDYTLVASAELLFKGYINTVDMKLKDPERGDHFSIEVESRLVRPPVSQYFNKETIQIIRGMAGDTFFNYLHTIPFTKASWGRMSNEDFTYRLPGGFRGSNRR